MVTKEQIQIQLAHLNGVADRKFIHLIENFCEAELCNRKNFTGHITASGTVIHLPSRRILLLHHKSLDKWLMPGGHMDAEDESPVAAALREVEEETGLSAEILIPMNVIEGVQYCIGIDSHPIPANEKKEEAAHYHHDFRFVFGYNGDPQIRIDRSESLNYKWVPVDDPYIYEILNPQELKTLALP